MFENLVDCLIFYSLANQILYFVLQEFLLFLLPFLRAANILLYYSILFLVFGYTENNDY